MKKNLITAVLMTIATTVLLGILYPLLITGIAQVIFPKQANGELIHGKDGALVGSQLIARVNGDVAKLQAENPGTPIPVDLVTTSGSGLDPDISPAAAEFQVRRVAAERKTSEADVAHLVAENSENRQWGFLGEPRVNVLELNIALDARYGRLH